MQTDEIRWESNKSFLDSFRTESKLGKPAENTKSIASKRRSHQTVSQAEENVSKSTFKTRTANSKLIPSKQTNNE